MPIFSVPRSWPRSPVPPVPQKRRRALHLSPYGVTVGSLRAGRDRLPHRGFGLMALLGVLMLSQVASGGTLFTSRGDALNTLRRNVLMVHNGRQEMLIETLDIDTDEHRVVWIGIFPSEPEASEAGSNPFPGLHLNTRVEEPYNRVMRKHVFGPSIVNLVVHRLYGDKGPTKKSVPEATRSAELDEFVSFRGQTKTSSITRTISLPDTMERWLVSRSIRILPEQRQKFSVYLNQGWDIVVVVAADPAPGTAGRLRLGPWRFDFLSPHVHYPTVPGPQAQGEQTQSIFYVIGDKPWVSKTHAILWDQSPWKNRSNTRGAFRTTYSRMLETNDLTLASAVERPNLVLPDQLHLLRSEHLYGTVPVEPFRFRVEPEARTLQDNRGNKTDLFLCLLLGLTPLFYTPESWFLLWLTGRTRAKARKRRTSKTMGLRLWALFAVATAAYWLVTLEGAGKIAAVLPLLIGLFQISAPYNKRDPLPVRAQLKKKEADA